MENYEFIIESDSENSEYEFILEEDELIEDIEKISVVDDTMHAVLCIDIGVLHLGLAAITYNKETYKLGEIVGVDLLDITEFHHPPYITYDNCKLNHTKTFADWMEHIFLTYKVVFDNANKIVIERQPPCGFVAIEQLIFSKYRHKTELISPNSVHKYLDINRFDYEKRKKKVVDFALRHIQNSKIKDEFLSFERKHDMADAISMGYFWIYSKRCEYKDILNKERILEIQMKYLNSKRKERDFLDQFRYTGHHRLKYLRL